MHAIGNSTCGNKKLWKWRQDCPDGYPNAILYFSHIN